MLCVWNFVRSFIIIITISRKEVSSVGIVIENFLSFQNFQSQLKKLYSNFIALELILLPKAQNTVAYAMNLRNNPEPYQLNYRGMRAGCIELNCKN